MILDRSFCHRRMLDCLDRGEHKRVNLQFTELTNNEVPWGTQRCEKLRLKCALDIIRSVVSRVNMTKFLKRFLLVPVSVVTIVPNTIFMTKWISVV